MFDKLSFIENQFEELAERISDPAVIADQETWRKLCKEHSDLTPIVEKYREYKINRETIEEARLMMDDPESDKEFKEMLAEESKQAKENIVRIEEELKILLLPKDPNDEKNVMVEIRGGAGGDEAALFAGDLFRMYSMYADTKRWKTEVLNISEIGIGGIKEVTFMIEGEGAYSRLKFESGVHRVQRVPETESSGRIHTSTVTVAVLPEVDDVEVEINPEDLQIDTYRSSGAGGQHVNKTESAIRITHIPTGIVVACQDERSQHKNREAAMKMLRTRLYDMMEQERNASIAADRKSQVGTGDRSERIRTYNFPQGRMTDHRIGLTLYKLENIMNGDLDEIIDALITTDQSEKLKAQGGER
ncbi:MAG: peptide chain release factor 1 [Clostridia bacterium]|nr:peptide chain release factor 1 [Clostridia bacterium]